MTIRERLDADLKDSMRARDQVKVDTIRAVKSAIKYKEVEGGEAKTIDEAAIVKVVSSLIKQRREAAEQFRAGNRPELADKEDREASILQAYLPQQLTADELDKLVAETVAETGAQGPKDMGAVMKAIGPKIGGRAEGKAVSEAVKKKLSGG